jgi:hypothetical protein
MTVIPSLVAIVQGAGDDKGCQNVTLAVTLVAIKNSSRNMTGETSVLEPIPLDPIFSVAVYFIIIAGFLLMSAVSFFLLNFSKYIKSGRKTTLIERTVILEETEYEKSLLQKQTESSKIPETEKYNSKEKVEIYFLYAMSFLITFVMWGSLSGLQSYSTLPYGSLNFDLFFFKLILSFR